MSLKNVGHEENTIGIPNDELSRLISKSKIVINLSKSRTSSVRNFTAKNIYSFHYQLKGRIIKAGLGGATCVSEYSPGQELLFTEEELPVFSTKEECVEILKKLLNDEELLNKYKIKFTSKAFSLFEDKKTFAPVFEAIESKSYEKVKLVNFPYWYLRISAKYVLLRNIKLSNFIKSILQFKLIFKIVQNTNLLIKLLIIIESIINTIWYSFTSTLKSKK